MSINTEEIVNAYIAVRDKRQAILKEYEEKDAELKADLDKLEQLLLTTCNEINADSLKTKNGLVMRKINERYFCSDWSNFYDFVRENDAVELLERRIHQGNFRQFMSEHKGEGLPPGVNVSREYGVIVRKASK
jgi:hypothetical protein